MSPEIILEIIIKYKYLALFAFAFFEGPIISLTAGFLVFGGYLSYFPAFLMLLMGDFIPDIISYYIGYFGNKNNLWNKYKAKINFISNNFDLIEHLWKNHPIKTMFFSKLAYGLSTPFLISAGLVKMPFKKYISITIPIMFTQHLIIMATGYFLGHSYAIAEKYIKLGNEFVAVVLIVIIISYVIFSRYAKKQIKIIEKES
jgi:membrane protein DedA with SNARE-associated domain